MRNVIWFSRHAPTERQYSDIISANAGIVAREAGMALGARNINSPEDLRALLADLRALAREVDAVAIYGVFPAPVQAALVDDALVDVDGDDIRMPCYAAWNVQRSEEGGLATFQHFAFVRVGYLDRRARA